MLCEQVAEARSSVASIYVRPGKGGTFVSI